MSRTANFIKNIVYFAIIFAFIFGIYHYRAQIQTILNGVVEKITGIISPPCSKPIRYSIGAIDPKFGMSNEQVLKFVREAGSIWDIAAGKTLLEKDNSADNPNKNRLIVNLIYDYRQQATEEMSKLGIVIGNDKATYDTLKAKYDSLQVSYKSEKVSIQSAIDAFNKEKSAYDKSVQYWNSQGGAPKEQYRQLEQQRNSLNANAIALNTKQKTFNSLVDTLNSVVVVMNRLVNNLNLNVKTYNTVGSSTGEEFSEGEYISDAAGRRINIYQFNDTGQLVRVLEHELGHALGLNHIENKKAVMYRLNESTNKELTAEDINELKRICKI
ncbi:MAG: matrixin family metalloprotease [Patescibacteria group bacterium]